MSFPLFFPFPKTFILTKSSHHQRSPYSALPNIKKRTSAGHAATSGSRVTIGSDHEATTLVLPKRRHVVILREDTQMIRAAGSGR